MPSNTVFKLAAFAASLSAVSATTLTLNDYVKFADGSAKYNPPTCAMPYDSLDLSRITAWSDITSDLDPQCGSCAKVCGSAGCDYLLVVDQCTLKGDHLDISTVAGPKIVGSDTGNHEVSMELVDVKNCAGIWDGRMFFEWQEPNANLKALKALNGVTPAVFAPSASAAPSSAAPVVENVYGASTFTPEVYPSSIIAEVPAYTEAPQVTYTLYTTPAGYSTVEPVSTVSEVYPVKSSTVEEPQPYPTETEQPVVESSVYSFYPSTFKTSSSTGTAPTYAAPTGMSWTAPVGPTTSADAFTGAATKSSATCGLVLGLVMAVFAFAA